MTSRLTAHLVLLVAMPLSAFAQSAPQLFLHEVRVTSTAPANAAWKDVTVELQMHPDGARRTAAVFARGAAEKLPDGSFRLAGRDYPGGKDKPGPAQRASTFMIDWKEPAVLLLLSSEQCKAGPQSLRDLVDRHIDKKGLSRFYDAASVVAKGRAGDCTEHAVLLAAVARRCALPARVVHGLVLVRHPQGVGAYGHAWVEVHRDRRWQVLDAALPSSLDPLYIPLAVVDEEGPAYLAKLFAQSTPADVEGVRISPRL